MQGIQIGCDSAENIEKQQVQQLVLDPDRALMPDSERLDWWDVQDGESTQRVASDSELTLKQDRATPKWSSATNNRKQLPALSLALLYRMSDMPLYRAAEQLGMSTSYLKNACRRLGLARWPRAGRSIGPIASSKSQPKLNIDYSRRLLRKYKDNTPAADGQNTQQSMEHLLPLSEPICQPQIFEDAMQSEPSDNNLLDMHVSESADDIAQWAARWSSDFEASLSAASEWADDWDHATLTAAADTDAASGDGAKKEESAGMSEVSGGRPPLLVVWV